MSDIDRFFQKFSNCEAWKTHLDFQIYKALNHRYQIGLEALNQHLPDFKIEIVYRYNLLYALCKI